jgi:hypothetical protein
MASYVMPKPFSVCLWYAQKTAPPAPALVLSAAERTIQVVVFHFASRHPEQRDGVRHISDPQIGTFLMADEQGGMWDFTADQKLLRQIAGLD